VFAFAIESDEDVLSENDRSDQVNTNNEIASRSLPISRLLLVSLVCSSVHQLSFERQIAC
jgi:hypothetical protein